MLKINKRQLIATVEAEFITPEGRRKAAMLRASTLFCVSRDKNTRSRGWRRGNYAYWGHWRWKGRCSTGDTLRGRASPPMDSLCWSRGNVRYTSLRSV